MGRAGTARHLTLIQMPPIRLRQATEADTRSESLSGTETSWLSSLPGKVVELHCQCPADIAVERFFNRERHPGHLDGLKVKSDELLKLARAEGLGPLQLGRGEFFGKQSIIDEIFRPLNRVLVERATLPMRVIDGGNIVVVQARGRNLTRDGKRYDNDYVFVIHFQDGKIVRYEEYCDTELIARVLPDRIAAKSLPKPA